MKAWTRLGSWPNKASVNRGGLGKKGEEGSDSDQGWEGIFSQEGLDESEIVVQFSVPLIFFCMADFYWMGLKALRLDESERCGGLSESQGVATP